MLDESLSSERPAGSLADLRHDFPGETLDLLIGQGPFARLHRHRNRDRFLARIDTLAFIDIEHGNAGNQLAVDILGCAYDVGGFDRTLDHEGEIAFDWLE